MGVSKISKIDGLKERRRGEVVFDKERKCATLVQNAVIVAGLLQMTPDVVMACEQVAYMQDHIQPNRTVTNLFIRPCILLICRHWMYVRYLHSYYVSAYVIGFEGCIDVRHALWRQKTKPPVTFTRSRFASLYQKSTLPQLCGY